MLWVAPAPVVYPVSQVKGPALPCVKNTVYDMSPKVPTLRIPVPKQGGRVKSPVAPGPVEGESAGRKVFRDRHGNMHTTPSRPIPASIRGPRVPCKAVTKRWWKVFRDSTSVFQDAGSRFKGQRKSKRVSWG